MSESEKSSFGVREDSSSIDPSASHASTPLTEDLSVREPAKLESAAEQHRYLANLVLGWLNTHSGPNNQSALKVGPGSSSRDEDGRADGNYPEALWRWLSQGHAEGPWSPFGSGRAQSSADLHARLGSLLYIFEKSSNVPSAIISTSSAEPGSEQPFPWLNLSLLNALFAGTGLPTRDPHSASSIATDQSDRIREIVKQYNRLSVSVSPEISPFPEIQHIALLDTGVDVSCISADLAAESGCEIEPAIDERNPELPVTTNGPVTCIGCTKLYVSWLESYEIRRAKMRFYVVPDLQHNIQVNIVIAGATAVYHGMFEAAKSYREIDSAKLGGVVPRVALNSYRKRSSAQLANPLTRVIDSSSEEGDSVNVTGRAPRVIAPLFLDRRTKQQKKDDQAALESQRAAAMLEDMLSEAKLRAEIQQLPGRNPSGQSPAGSGGSSQQGNGGP